MCNVLVIGSVNMDIVAPLERLPLPGETLRAGEIRLFPGGKGANAAVAAARLGANVRFVGCVGDDVFGTTLRDNLIAEGIDCTYLATIADCTSGSAMILLSSVTGQNSILIGAGANQRVSVPDDTELFVWADALILQLEIPIEVCEQAIARAREHGVLVVFDPAPAFANLPAAMFADVDILSPNESELGLLTGLPTDSLDEVRTACRVLIGRGVKHVVAKLGERGALHMSAEHEQHCPPFEVKAVDTTAAGDSFTAALTLARLNKRDWIESLRQGCAAGALACTKPGAQASLPTITELNAFLSIGKT